MEHGRYAGQKQRDAFSHFRDYQPEDQEHHHSNAQKCQQDAQRSAAMHLQGTAAVRKQVPLIKTHGDVDNVGDYGTDNQRRCRSKQNLQEMCKSIPVVDAEKQQKSAYAQPKAGFPIQFHIVSYLVDRLWWFGKWRFRFQ